MLTKISNVYLYTCNDADSDAAKEWLDLNEVPFTLLHYGDAAQHPLVFTALNGWFNTNFNSFPIVVYDEIHDDKPSERSYIYGLESLMESTLAELYQLGQ